MELGDEKSQMQTAMTLTVQKPKQRARKINGECSEGLPGSTKSVGCVERSVENLRDPGVSWQEAGRRNRNNK